MGLAQNKKYNFFGKKLPAWVLLAALIAMGAGAATGLVLKDQINGTTTIAVSQALLVKTAPTLSGGDERLATLNDDYTEWAAHFEANNGDTLTLDVVVTNEAGSPVAGTVACSLPAGLTMEEDSSDIVEIALHTWKFPAITGGGTDTLSFNIAIEDAAATGFYDLSCTIQPVNV